MRGSRDLQPWSSRAGRTWLLLASAVALGLAALVAISSPAVACSGTRLLGDPESPADYVFTGTAVRLDDPTDALTMSSAEMMTWTFVVDGVELGRVGLRFTVVSPRSGGSCGFEFQLGRRYLVRAVDAPEGPVVWLSSGTRKINSLSTPPLVEGTFMPFSTTVLRLLPVTLVLGGVIGVAGWSAWRRFSELKQPDT